MTIQQRSRTAFSAFILFIFTTTALASDNPTLCQAEERIMWSCHRDGRMASLCGAADNTFLQFRMGSADDIEVSAPAAGTAPNDVFATERFASNYAFTLTLENAMYRVFEYIRFDEDQVTWRNGDSEGEMICASTHDEILSLYEFGVR